MQNIIFLEESISLHTVQPLPSRKAFLQLTGTQFEVTGHELFYFCKDLLNLLNRAGIILTQVQSVDKFTLFREKNPAISYTSLFWGALRITQVNVPKCSAVSVSG